MSIIVPYSSNIYQNFIFLWVHRRKNVSCAHFIKLEADHFLEFYKRIAPLVEPIVHFYKLEFIY